MFRKCQIKKCHRNSWVRHTVRLRKFSDCSSLSLFLSLSLSPLVDPQYWRISLYNTSSLNRCIQLSSSNMCSNTVEFCMWMHFRYDFLGRSRWRKRRLSERFIRSRLCEIQLRALYREITSWERAPTLLHRTPSLTVAVTYWNSRHPFRETIHVLNHGVIFSEKF